MSGLALVVEGARGAGHGLRSRRLPLLRAPPRRGHRAGDRPRRDQLPAGGRSWSSRPPSRRTTPRSRQHAPPAAHVLHRGDLLGELSRMKRTIAVGGTHGKTTTASMAAHVLRETGRDPAFLIGGELRSAGTNADWGEGAWAVIEADESDRSFLKLYRPVAVVTNVELDHHATYANLGELEEAFAEFAEPAELLILGPGVELQGRGRRGALRRARARGAVSGRVALRRPGNRGGASRSRPPQHPERARRPGRLPRGGGGAGRGRPGARHVHGSGAPLRVPRPHGIRGEDLRRLRPPSDRGARHPGGGPHPRRQGPARGLLPAPPLLPHAPAGARVRPRARARRPRGGARRLSRPRASRGLPRRERPDGGPGRGGRRRRAAGLVAPADGGRASGCSRPSWGRATSC